ncbi:MAG: hypothetical protein QNK35_11680 [Bacteroides sp.]|nr:hypothetical protein [Bacteroides sp.]
MSGSTLPLKPFPQKPERVKFDSKELDLDWNYVQIPEEENFSLTERKGYLRLKGSAEILGTKNNSTFVGKRLRDFYFTASTELDFDPKREN